MCTKLIIIYFFFFIYKDKFVILSFTQLKIIQNILTTITSLTYFNKLSSHIHSNIPQSKHPQLFSHFLHKSSHFHSSTPSNPNKALNWYERKVKLFGLWYISVDLWRKFIEVCEWCDDRMKVCEWLGKYNKFKIIINNLI